MAEGGSWPSIRQNGLLSTSKLLDLYEYSGDRRYQIEKCHRSESVRLGPETTEGAVVRDQKPMSDGGLRRALPPDIDPSEWYAILNSKTFFWTSENRLHRLLNARPYRNDNHDVLTISTKKLIELHENDIFLCPINSGCTKPFPHPRDRNAFLSIAAYPFEHWKKKRPSWDALVEVSVEGGVPNIIECVVSVDEMCGDKIIKALWPANGA